MKKQGFTLIELMVVIVIMGILAAVAVPKLFGMIAKSKASEIGTAAGSYVKLQDAYVAESGLYVGNWGTIGYSMPNTTNFSYDDVDLKSAATTALKNLNAKVGWLATSNAKLNDCVAGSTWQVNVSENTGAASSGSPVKYGTAVSTAASCTPLTPNFHLIGK